jgi:hypothetical protein
VKPEGRRAGKSGRREREEDERPSAGGGYVLWLALIGGGVVLVAAIAVVLVVALNRPGGSGAGGGAGGQAPPKGEDAPLPELNPKEVQLKAESLRELGAADANTRRNAIAKAGQTRNLAAHLYDNVLAAWNDPEYIVKRQVVNFLSLHQNKPSRAVPILIEAMDDKTLSGGGEVFFALSKYGTHAKAALPLARRHILVNSNRMGSLGQDVQRYRGMGATDEEVLSLLSEFLRNKEFKGGRDRAADILAGMGAAAKPALSDLLAYAKEPDPFRRGFNSPAYQALKKIDPEAARKAGVP